MTNEQFIAIWQRADSREAAAKALGVLPNTASVRASYLRRYGIPLKRFRDVRPLDVQKLKKVAAANR